jgi:hypothetical protein
MPDTISPTGMNSGAYVEFNDPNHPDYRPKLIEDDATKERKSKLGRSTLDEIMEGL